MGHRRFHDKYYDKGLRGWIVRTAKKNYWRVAAWYELDDLIQDGMLAYAICRQRYRHRVENRRHFMSLVQVVYLNLITDLANERTKSIEDICISQIAVPGKELAALEYLAGGYEGDAELQVVLGNAPAEIRAFLNLLQTPEGVAKLEMPTRRRKDGSRETTAEHLTWALGMPIDNLADIETGLRNLLGAAI